MRKLIFAILLLPLAVLAQPLPPPRASQAEANAGVNNFKYITPATLSGFSLNQGNGLTLTQGTNLFANMAVSGTNAFSGDGGGLTNLFYLNKTASPLVREFYNRSFLGFPNATAGKWYVDIGPLNYGKASFDVDWSVSANTFSNAILKDVHFWMEDSYFFDLHEHGNSTYMRVAGGGAFDPALDTQAESVLTTHLYSQLNGKVVIEDGSTLIPEYALYDFAARFYPSHIESQVHPYAQLVAAGMTISGFNSAGALVATSQTANGSTGTASATGTDIAFIVTITPGGSGITTGDVVSIAYIRAYQSAPTVVFTPGNANAAGAKFYVDNAGSSASTLKIGVTGSALSSGQAYILNCHVMQ